MKDLVDKYDAVALMSGGLDSILAMRTIMDQGLKVLGLHFYSPFFGHPELIEHWQKIYGIEIKSFDISDDLLNLLKVGPKHGFGACLNPCTDCHILMIKKAKEIMKEIHAKFIISGEVIWQRPMSQRQDTMNIIHRDSETKDILLRPLCALWLEPTPMENSGLVNRQRLLKISGRGRSEQLELANKYGFTEIPMPGGGCVLTEQKSTARFWKILESFTKPNAEDFALAQAGRFFTHDAFMLAISKRQGDAKALSKIIRPTDLCLELVGQAGPLAIGRSENPWDEEKIFEAASLMASYATKTISLVGDGKVLKVSVKLNEEEKIINVLPKRESIFKEPSWEETTAALKAFNQARLEERKQYKREKFLNWIPRKK